MSGRGRCFCLGPEAPYGFRAAAPTSAELLSGAVAVLAPSVGDALALHEQFALRVRGLVITPGGPFALRSWGPHLWHLTAPVAMMPTLSETACSLLEMMDSDEPSSVPPPPVPPPPGTLPLPPAKDASGDHQRERLESLARLARGVAHSFNNVLGGIMGPADLLATRASVSAEDKQFLEMIVSAAQDAAQLTAELLSFARIHPMIRAPLDGHASIIGAIAALRETAGPDTDIVDALAAEPCVVLGDADQLREAWVRLGTNACDAMPRGGTLTFRSELIRVRARDRPAHLEHVRPGPYLRVEVRDTGSGIAPDDLERVYEPFFTTKPPGEGGSGMGLSAVFGAVRQHKGAIDIRSAQGEGTVVSIYLPLAHGSEPAPPIVATSKPVSGSGRILVVDDDAAVRRTTRAVLQELGYEVIVADDGDVALARLRQRHPAIDLVLLDMVMPRMNGAQTFHAIRRLDPNLPVVLCSGFISDSDLAQLQAAGLDGYVRKPYQAAALSHVVADVIRTHARD